MNEALMMPVAGAIRPFQINGDSDRVKIRALPWALGSGVLNSFFFLWTFGGSLFVLFLNELGLPKGQIGVILSLFPFCGLLALGFAPFAARLGRRRVFLACFGVRKAVMALLLLLPWVTTRFGQGFGIWFLIGVIIVFAVIRSLCETAWFPWQQEFVPNRVRGRFAAWSALTGLVASAVALAIAGRVLETVSGLTGYMWLIGAGSMLGLVGGLLTFVGDSRVVMPFLTVDGYAVMFFSAFLFLAAGGLLYKRVRPDYRHTTRTAVRSFLNRMAQR